MSAIMRFRPVSMARKRQLSMTGIKLFNAQNEVVDDPCDNRGILLHVLSVRDAKTGEEVIELKSTSTYDLITQTIVVSKVTGKDPVMLFNISSQMAGIVKSSVAVPMIEQGWESPLVFRMSPLASITAEEIVGSVLGHLLILE